MGPVSSPRAAAQICLIAVLTSCSPTFMTPLGPETAVPAIAGTVFTSYDNTELPLRVWLPPGDPAAVIVALHGFNDYSNFIAGGAPFFTARRLAVYAYDQRGFGETATRGRWSGQRALRRDLATFTALVRAAHPGTPLYILGDSMGGAVTILTMAGPDPPAVDGVILVAPAVWARTEMPFYQRAALAIAARLMPWLKVSGKTLNIRPSDNDEMLRELGSDPLVIKETRIDVLYGLANLMDNAYDSAERLRCRLLLLYGEKDEIIPREPVLSFYRRLPLKSGGYQRMIRYDEGYHMLMRDLRGEAVMADIAAWIEAGTRQDPPP